MRGNKMADIKYEIVEKMGQLSMDQGIKSNQLER